MLCVLVMLFVPELVMVCEEPVSQQDLAKAETISHQESSEEVANSVNTSPVSQSLEATFRRLADCESGNWIDGGSSFQQGSARWNWGAPGVETPPWGTNKHHGGLQFNPSTWNWVAPMVGVSEPYAYSATPQQQMKVAEKTLELQGWNAWPTCARKLGLL